MIGICENQAAWDGALENSFYHFITYRYGWLKAWASGTPELKPLFIAGMNDDDGCDFVCPVYVDTKARVLTGAVGVTPGFLSANVTPNETVTYLINVAKREKLGKIVLQIPPGYSYSNNLIQKGFVLRRKVSFYVLPVNCFNTFEEYVSSISNKGKKSDIRFSLKAGLKIETASYSPETYRRFAVFLSDMAARNRASLPGERMYEVLNDYYPKDSIYWIATHNGMDVGSALTFACKDQIWIMWLQGGEQHRNLKVDTYLYAEIIRYAIDNGFRVVNFGTSPIDTPLGDFKRRLEAQLEFHELYELDLNISEVIKQYGSSLKRYVKSKYVTHE
ncbi:MAG: GNAT family N-acetyltransferase [Desulfuromonadaceae bacterium]